MTLAIQLKLKVVFGCMEEYLKNLGFYLGLGKDLIYFHVVLPASTLTPLFILFRGYQLRTRFGRQWKRYLQGL